MEIADVQRLAAQVKSSVGQVIVGKDEPIDLLLVALLCEGHVLIEDVPGIGKTTLAKSLSRVLGCSFRRIQFTPDLLPTDVVGVSIYNQKSGDFEYRPGPVLSQIVLADEINRAGPRTQSALLEAMEERQVTVDGVTRPIPRPFLVMATQNPIELEGTFPLPEAQLDRFLLKVALGYPELNEERTILRRFRDGRPLEDLHPVVSAQDILDMGARSRQVAVGEAVEDYLLGIVRATRHQTALALGASPRASLALYHASQAYAALQGRDFVLPDDIKRLTGPVLSHRMILSSQSRLRGQNSQDVLREVLLSVQVPVEERSAP
ncbi:MAG: MoxR family ATPase [Chloroflexi bacterium]|nr:MoxR family ATPase [Chloroflexota bacterium]